MLPDVDSPSRSRRCSSAGLSPDGATVIANSASGVSGAGNSPKRELLFGEIAENFRAYGVGNTHRHLNEMTATLESWGANADLVFTPHLLPSLAEFSRRSPCRSAVRSMTCCAPWRESYAGEPFIEITNEHARASRCRPPKRRAHWRIANRGHADADAAHHVGD